MPTDIKLQDGESAVIFRNNGEVELYIPDVPDDEELAEDSPAIQASCAFVSATSEDIFNIAYQRLQDNRRTN